MPDLIERDPASGPQASERVLVTTLTKRLAEDLTHYLPRSGPALQVAALASWTPSSACRSCASCAKGRFDVLVGVNLLREGLDLPEVSLVAILDADKEGFLRSETSLIQTIGRAARNVNAEVILYADKVTDSMQRAIDETQPPPRAATGVQRRARHHAGDDQSRRSAAGSRRRSRPARWCAGQVGRDEAPRPPRNTLSALDAEMLEAAEKLEFERAAALRDKIQQLRSASGGGPARPAASPQGLAPARRPRRRPGRAAGQVLIVAARPAATVGMVCLVQFCLAGLIRNAPGSDRIIEFGERGGNRFYPGFALIHRSFVQ